MCNIIVHVLLAESDTLISGAGSFAILILLGFEPSIDAANPANRAKLVTLTVRFSVTCTYNVISFAVSLITESLVGWPHCLLSSCMCSMLDFHEPFPPISFRSTTFFSWIGIVKRKTFRWFVFLFLFSCAVVSGH